MNAEQLREWREAHGCTWKALGEALGVDPNTVRRWARGELGIGQPRLLALALERLDDVGLAPRPVPTSAIRDALKSSRYLQKKGRMSPRLAAARAALACTLKQPKDARDPLAVRAALSEHGKAFAALRKK